MKITVNGDLLDFKDKLSAAELVEELGLSGKRLALEVNREIVPRSQFQHHCLQEGDHVEIVQAIGGG